MKRVNAYALHYIGLAVGQLQVIAVNGVTYGQVQGTAYYAKGALDLLAMEAFEPPLPLSKQEAQKISQTLGTWVAPEQAARPNDQIPQIEIWWLNSNIQRFDHVLSAELGQAELYLIPSKRAYAVPTLLSRAESALSPDALAGLGNHAIADLREAGRCLALDSATAVGFHVFRALEEVIVQYFPVLGLRTPRYRNWGRYIEVLKKAGVNVKISAMLEHLKDHYRNPIIHPEVVLTADEAANLFSFATSAIDAIVRDIQEERQKRATLAVSVPATSAILTGPS